MEMQMFSDLSTCSYNFTMVHHGTARYTMLKTQEEMPCPSFHLILLAQCCPCGYGRQDALNISQFKYFFYVCLGTSRSQVLNLHLRNLNKLSILEIILRKWCKATVNFSSTNSCYTAPLVKLMIVWFLFGHVRSCKQLNNSWGTSTMKKSWVASEMLRG